MDQVEEIKSRIDIVDLVGEYVNLKKAGRNYKALCPFHDEKTPSFMVSPELQIFKCFGCGKSGDAIEFLKLYENIEFWDALEILAKRAGVKLERKGSSKQNKLKEKLYTLNDLAGRFYHWLLTEHDKGKKVLKYAQNRGLTKQTIKQFQLGFSPMDGETIPKFLKKKGFSGQEIIKSGIAFQTKRGNLWDRFRGRLVFPLHDYRGRVIGFSGRLVPGVIDDDDKPKYINSPETPIYQKRTHLFGFWQTKDAIRDKNRVFVVEGETDVLSAFQADFKNVVAIKGTAFTPQQAQKIKRYADTAVFALDADFAGTEAIKRSSQVAEKVGLNVEVVSLPEKYQDIDELAQKGVKKLKELTKQTEPIYDFVIAKAEQNNDLSTPQGKQEFLNTCLTFVTQIENEVIKNGYLKQMADALRVDLQSVIIEANKFKPKTDRNYQKKDFTPKKKLTVEDNRYLIEKHLLALILSRRDWQWLEDEEIEGLIQTSLFKKIIRFLKEKNQEDEGIKIKNITQSIPEELKQGFQEIYLWGEQLNLEYSKEKIDKAFLRLKGKDLREKLNKLSKQISQEENKKGSDDEKLIRLEKKFVRLSKKLTSLQGEVG
jgi:DNA primase